ncbi:YfiR family protein [Vibrio stylophorae]|nr:YfiR family protein [Vibrio stylophorae]
MFQKMAHFYFSIMRILFGMSLMLFCVSAHAKYSETDLKAVYLYRFALLAEWHQTQYPPHQIYYCATQASPVTEQLARLVAAKKDRAHFHLLTDQSVPNCQLIYVDPAAKAELDTLKQHYPNALLVGNGRSFIKMGGMISLIKVNNRIKPLISIKNIEATGVKIRAQLLSIAELASEAQ